VVPHDVLLCVVQCWTVECAVPGYRNNGRTSQYASRAYVYLFAVASTDPSRRRAYDTLKADTLVPKDKVGTYASSRSQSSWPTGIGTKIALMWGVWHLRMVGWPLWYVGVIRSRSFSARSLLCLDIRLPGMPIGASQAFLHFSPVWHPNTNNNDYLAPEEYARIMQDSIFVLCPKVSW